MNNYLKHTSKFIFTFISVTTLLMILYFFLSTTKTQEQLKAFNNENIRNHCINSPQDQTFQECYRKKLPLLVSSATPIDLILIYRVLDNTLERDLNSTLDKPPFINIYLIYYENIGILIDHLRNYRLDRADLRFIQIISLPIIKLYFKYKLKIKKEAFFKYYKQYIENKNHQSLTFRWNNIFSKFDLLDFKPSAQEE